MHPIRRIPSMILAGLLALAPLAARSASTAQLQVMGEETAQALADQITALGLTAGHPLNEVVVYPFVPPTATNFDALSEEQQKRGRRIARRVLDALVHHEDFHMLTRELGGWKHWTDTEAGSGLLDPERVAEVGRGDGARWVVTGRFFDEDHRLHLDTLLFHIELGSLPATHLAVEPDGWGLQLHHLKRNATWLLALASLLALAGIGARATRRRHRQQARARQQADTARLEAALAARDPAPPSPADTPSPAAPQERLAILNAPAAALRLTGLPGGDAVLAPGPEQGLGRGPRWPFRFADPRVSRRPHARVRADAGRFFLMANAESGSPTRVNGEPVNFATLADGDRIALGVDDATELTVALEPNDAWLRLDVVAGPDTGISCLLIQTRAGLGSAPDAALPLPGLPPRAAYIAWDDQGRPLLSIPPDAPWPLPGIERRDTPLLVADGDRLEWGETVVTWRRLDATADAE